MAEKSGTIGLETVSWRGLAALCVVCTDAHRTPARATRVLKKNGR